MGEVVMLWAVENDLCALVLSSFFPTQKAIID